MKRFKGFIGVIVSMVILLSFNAQAMNDENYVRVYPTPQNETKYEDESKNQYWTWLSDNLCVQFRGKNYRSQIEEMYNLGTLTPWADQGRQELKKRDTYSGKWNQAEDGTWSFTFDDCTIPVGLTKIDDVIYAFNGHGELKEGYKYWNDYATAADGIATCQEPEYLTWLETQYVPACTSHE